MAAKVRRRDNNTTPPNKIKLDELKRTLDSIELEGKSKEELEAFCRTCVILIEKVYWYAEEHGIDLLDRHTQQLDNK